MCNVNLYLLVMKAQYTWWIQEFWKEVSTDIVDPDVQGLGVQLAAAEEALVFKPGACRP